MHLHSRAVAEKFGPEEDNVPSEFEVESVILSANRLLRAAWLLRLYLADPSKMSLMDSVPSLGVMVGIY